MLLTDHQRNILDCLKQDRSAKEVSDIFKCSLESMSSKLAKLYARGYTDRRSVVDETGGIYYLYKERQL